jgi:hypothetical protein
MLKALWFETCSIGPPCSPVCRKWPFFLRVFGSPSAGVCQVASRRPSGCDVFHISPRRLTRSPASISPQRREREANGFAVTTLTLKGFVLRRRAMRKDRNAVERFKSVMGLGQRLSEESAGSGSLRLRPTASRRTHGRRTLAERAAASCPPRMEYPPIRGDYPIFALLYVRLASVRE